VIARASDREVFAAVGGDSALQHGAAALQRVHTLMLALLPRFATPPQQTLLPSPHDQPDHQHTLYYKVSHKRIRHMRVIKIYRMDFWNTTDFWYEMYEVNNHVDNILE
jgi:hypothetical protein